MTTDKIPRPIMKYALQHSAEAKCIVWDLDNTIWEGILLEQDPVTLKPGIKDIIIELDARGILHSIASKNNYEDAIKKLKEFGLEQYFLYPEIHWGAKSGSLKNIRQNLNIGMDTIVFVDDQPFEREEVSDANPEVETLDAMWYLDILAHRRLNPRFITEDSQRRRLMYLEDTQRTREEEEYKGPREQFLASLQMEFIISEAREEDLERAEELTVRTNQLNATGITYSYEELRAFMESEEHILYICELSDKYGSYGKIGLALVEKGDAHWCLHMLLMSCRVMSRSAGSLLLTHIMQQAKTEGKKLLARFKQTDRNKMMYITFKFGNFHELSNDGKGNILFEHDLSLVPPFPPYIDIKYPQWLSAK